MPPCGHLMQVVNKDNTCYFNVIFYFEIILLIKSLSTVAPVSSHHLTAVWPGHGRGWGVRGEFMWRSVRRGGEKDKQPSNKLHDALTIYRGNVSSGRDVIGRGRSMNWIWSFLTYCRVRDGEWCGWSNPFSCWTSIRGGRSTTSLRSQIITHFKKTWRVEIHFFQVFRCE